jgi:hypothetical protein
MPDTYIVECECHNKMRVELFQAGTSQPCPSCGATVKIPSSHRLKECSGDKFPFLAAIEKIRVAVESQSAPFDGVCHGCGHVSAAYSTPLNLRILVEREMDHDGKIRPTITGGIKLVAAASRESWQTTTFPLLLCQKCQVDFTSDRFKARIQRYLKVTFSLGLLGAFLYVVYYHAELIAALSGILSIIGAIAWAAGFSHAKEVEPFINSWLRNIRWVPDAISDEDEYQLSIGLSTPIKES